MVANREEKPTDETTQIKYIRTYEKKQTIFTQQNGIKKFMDSPIANTPKLTLFMSFLIEIP
jgi:hypothetical protein